MFLSLAEIRERRLLKDQVSSTGKNRLVLSSLNKSPRVQTALAGLLVFSPAFVVAFFVLANAVNIPVWDDWERGVLLQKYYSNSPDFFSYMMGAHIDHRMFVPRVLMLVMNDITGGNLWFA